MDRLRSGSSASSSVWSILASGMASFAGLISGMLLARALGPASRGELAAVVSWVGVLGVASDLGIGFAVAYYVGREPDRANVVFSQGIVTALLSRVAAVIVGLAALPHISGLNGIGIAPLSIALSVVIVGGPTGVLTSVLLGSGRVRGVNTVTLVTSWAYALGVALLWAEGERRVAAYIVAFALAQTAACAAALWLGRRWAMIRWKWSSVGWGSALSYGLKTQLASLAAQTNLRVDQLFMSILVPSAELGLYVAAVALSSITGPLYAGVNVALTPRVIRAADEREGALTGLRAVALAVLLGTAAAGVLAGAASWLIWRLFGSRFTDAAWIARILLLASVFQGSNLLLGSTLRGLNRPGAPARAEGIGAVLTIGLLVALLPKHGAMGAAVASLVSYATVAVAEFVMVVRTGGMSAARVASELLGVAGPRSSDGGAR